MSLIQRAKPRLIDFAGGEPAEHHDRFGLVRGEIDAVEAEEESRERERRPLVAVDEGVVAGDPKGIRRRKRRQAGLLVVPID